MSVRRIVRRVMLGAIVSMMATTLGQAPIANADVDNSLCNNSAARTTIPHDFPLDACFDGSTLHVVNSLDFPVIVNVSGDAGEIQRAPRLGGSLSSTFLAFVSKETPNVVMPGWGVKVPIGRGEAKVELASTVDLAKNYAYAKLIWKYAPGISNARILVELGNELGDVANKYMKCMANNNNWGDIGCRAIYVRDVAFAAGRAGVSVIATGLAGGLLALIDVANWSDKLAQDVAKSRRGTPRFTIGAAPEPPKEPSPPVQQPEPQEPNPPQGENPPPPPVQPPGGNDSPPQPPSRTITVQNKYLVGSNGMAEDSVPTYLSTRMEPRCRVNGCKLDGTEMGSGDTFTATCYNHGTGMTNQNKNVPDDDANPNRVDSTLWYWGTRNELSGYISEVYVVPSDRGGAGLPHC